MLTVRVDTILIQPTDNDIVVPVYYSQQGDSTLDFYGFDSRISYDTTKLRAIQVIFNGSASENESYHIGGTSIAGDVRAEVLGQPGVDIDTTNPVLYFIRFTVLSPTFDTAFLTLYRFDVTPPMHIDSIRKLSGWLRHSTPVIPTHGAVTLSTAEGFGKSDSMISLPIMISDPTQANILQARFSFAVDTSILRYLGSTGGSLGSEQLVTSDNVNGLNHVVTIRAVDSTKPLAGAGVLLTLHFQAVHRTDSVCTELRDTSFSVTNSGAHLDSATLRFNPICVLGQSAVGVARYTVEPLAVWPNPFHTEFRVRLQGDWRSMYLELSDISGKVLLSEIVEHETTIRSALATGMYIVHVAPVSNSAIDWSRMETVRLVRIH